MCVGQAASQQKHLQRKLSLLAATSCQQHYTYSLVATFWFPAYLWWHFGCPGLARVFYFYFFVQAMKNSGNSCVQRHSHVWQIRSAYKSLLFLAFIIFLLWLLQLFLSPLDRTDMDIPFGAELSTVFYSEHTDQLWIFDKLSSTTKGSFPDESWEMHESMDIKKTVWVAVRYFVHWARC